MNLATALNALRSAIAADAAWAALTGNAGVIVEAPINGTPGLPFAKWAVAGDMPQLDLEGLDRVRVDITFYGATRAAVRAMDDYLASNWRIPNHATIASGNYRLSGFRRLRSHELPRPIQITPDGAWLVATVSEWELRVTKAV